MTEDQKNAFTQLHRALKPGSEVYTHVTHRSRSGMMRHVRVYVVADGKIEDISFYVMKLCGYRTDDKGLKVAGCGFHAGFDVVYNLGSALWPKGTNKPHGTRNGEPDTSGGYALKQRDL